MMMAAHGSIIALDVGTVRIGIAKASLAARLASPLTTLPNTDEVFARIAELCEAEEAVQVVLGLPRGLDGQTTAQTQYVQEFAHTLALALTQPISLVDEAVTSRQAEAELKTRGRAFEKGDIDALAAVYILEDYLHETGQAHG